MTQCCNRRREKREGGRSPALAAPGDAALPIESQKIGFVKLDGTSVLLDVAGIINSAWKSAEVSRLYGFQMTHAEFSGRSDGLQADALLLPPNFNT